MTENAMIAIAIASMASCTAVGSYSAVNRSPEYPGTACVRAAWTQADRIECVKAQAIKIAPSAAPDSKEPK